VFRSTSRLSTTLVSSGVVGLEVGCTVGSDDTDGLADEAEGAGEVVGAPEENDGAEDDVGLPDGDVEMDGVPVSSCPVGAGVGSSEGVALGPKETDGRSDESDGAAVISEGDSEGTALISPTENVSVSITVSSFDNVIVVVRVWKPVVSIEVSNGLGSSFGSVPPRSYGAILSTW